MTSFGERDSFAIRRATLSMAERSASPVRSWRTDTDENDIRTAHGFGAIGSEPQTSFAQHGVENVVEVRLIMGIFQLGKVAMRDASLSGDDVMACLGQKLPEPVPRTAADHR